MNILCVAPYHVTGTLSLWKREFARHGHKFRYVTLFRSPYDFEEDICLDLPLMPSSDAFIRARGLIYRTIHGAAPDDRPIAAKPPFQPLPHPAMQAFFDMRDRMLAPRIESAIRGYNLDAADIIWLDQGAEFYRNGRTVERWARLGKPMMAFYHGSDMRNRGILPQIDRHLSLRLTSEVDLLFLDDRLEYLFLPIDTRDPGYAPVTREAVRRDGTGAVELSNADESRLASKPGQASFPAARGPQSTVSGAEDPDGFPIRIGHASRMRSNKGSDTIIDVVTELRLRGYPVEMVMIENRTHAEALNLIASCDVFVDQIADAGGWGYGMAGVEALALGLPVITRMGAEMQRFLPDHPFIHATAETLEAELIRLAENSEVRAAKGHEGRAWVERTHDIRAIAGQLIEYWQREGWM